MAGLAQVSSVCKILETYMDFVQTASTLFRDLGGLAKMIERLEWEIARGSEPLGQVSAGTQNNAFLPGYLGSYQTFL